MRPAAWQQTPAAALDLLVHAGLPVQQAGEACIHAPCIVVSSAGVAGLLSKAAMHACQALHAAWYCTVCAFRLQPQEAAKECHRKQLVRAASHCMHSGK